MFRRKDETEGQMNAEILLAGQSLSFKLSESETMELIENLEAASYDFKRMDAIKLFHPDGRLNKKVSAAFPFKIFDLVGVRR